MFPVTTINDEGLEVWHAHEPMNGADPWGIAVRPWQFEALTTHQITGDEYDLRRFDYEHPLYHLVEFNVPQNRNGGIHPDERCVLLKGEEPVILSNRWHEDGYGQPLRAIGKQRVEYCTGLYGMEDKKTGHILHKSMRDWWPHVKSWKNYTLIGNSTKEKKPISIFENKWEDVENFCKKVIGNDMLLGRVLETLLYIRDGHYINLYTLMRNNKAPASMIRKITQSISVKDPKTIHVSTTGKGFNLEKICMLYESIAGGRLNMSHSKFVYMANIVNWILNNPRLMKLRPLDGMTYKAQDKYWFAVRIVNNAIYRDRIVANVGVLPKWFKKLALESFRLTPKYKTLRGFRVLNELTEREKSELTLVQSCGLESPRQLYPPMEKVREICGVTAMDNKYFKDFAKYILAPVSVITRLEIQALWTNYVYTRRRNRPDEFWSWCHNMANGYDPDDIMVNPIRGRMCTFAEEVYGICVSHDSWETKEPAFSDCTTSSLYWETDTISSMSGRGYLYDEEEPTNDDEMNYEDLLLGDMEEDNKLNNGYHVTGERLDDEFENLPDIDELRGM